MYGREVELALPGFDLVTAPRHKTSGAMTPNGEVPGQDGLRHFPLGGGHLDQALPGAEEEMSFMVMKFYSPEFKADAVALYLSDAGHTLAGVAQDLGMSRGTLRDWVRAERARHGGADSTNTRTMKEPAAG